MKYPEEDWARDLYNDLTQRFTNRDQSILCSIEGRGIHWLCIVKYDRYTCFIDCFDEFGRAEYAINFQQNSKKMAGGRTHSKLETIHAVEVWIKSGEISLLYKQFSFVDRVKRDIIRIGKDLIAFSPELSSLAKLKSLLADDMELWFESKDRNVSIRYYTNNDDGKIIDAAFRWGTRESSILFTIKTLDRSCLAEILKRWVCDRALPSELRVKFPWIEMDDLADFYEQGNAIEGELLRSWDSTMRFYEAHKIFLGDNLTNLILKFMRAMRDEGYDRKFIASQGHYQLFLRSQNNNSCNSSYLYFRSEYENYDVDGTSKTIQALKVSYHINHKTIEEFEEDEIGLTNRIRDLLNKLLVN